MTLLHSTLLALSLLAAPPAEEAKNAPERVVIDRVAAIVNGEVVTLQELIGRAGEELRTAYTLPGDRQEEAVGRALRRAFEIVVADRLLSAQAKELGFEATDPQIDQAVAEVMKANRFTSEAQLRDALEGQGLSMEQWRGQLRREFEAFNVLRYRVRARVKISEEDLKNYYQAHELDFAGEEQVHVRHIFLPLREDAPEAEVARVRALGERVKQRLATGEVFAKLAQEVSEGPGADDGGDLGWLARGTIQKSLEDVAFALDAGQTSELVRAGPGLHLFKVEERRKAGGRTFEDARKEIEERLTNEQAETYRQQYLAELRRDAVIELKIPELKDAPSRS